MIKLTIQFCRDSEFLTVQIRFWNELIRAAIMELRAPFYS